MQGTAGKPAGKRLVEGRHAKADEAAVLARQDRKIRNGAAQCMQGFRPFADGDHGLLMFMFCSRFPQLAADVKHASRQALGRAGSRITICALREVLKL
jgi:hypothetical protein